MSVSIRFGPDAVAQTNHYVKKPPIDLFYDNPLFEGIVESILHKKPGTYRIPYKYVAPDGSIGADPNPDNSRLYRVVVDGPNPSDCVRVFSEGRTEPSIMLFDDRLVVDYTKEMNMMPILNTLSQYIEGAVFGDAPPGNHPPLTFKDQRMGGGERVAFSGGDQTRSLNGTVLRFAKPLSKSGFSEWMALDMSGNSLRAANEFLDDQERYEGYYEYMKDSLREHGEEADNIYRAFPNVDTQSIPTADDFTAQFNRIEAPPPRATRTV